MIKSTLYYLMFFPLLISVTAVFAEDATSSISNQSAYIVDFKIEGDTTLNEYDAVDDQHMKDFGQYLKAQLHKRLNIEVLNKKQIDSHLQETIVKTDLHHCNGCELDIGKQLGVDLIVLPRIYRMSILIQTLYLDIWDVKTGRQLVHMGRNFRGNTTDGWKHAVDNILTGLQNQS